MSQVIWKYHLKDLTAISKQTLKLPFGAELLELLLVDNGLYIWFSINPDNKLVDVKFHIFDAFGTAETFETQGKHIKTYKHHGNIWHVFMDMPNHIPEHKS
jgi:hypothetical protein